MTRTRVFVLVMIVLATSSGCSGYRVVKPDYAPPPAQSGTAPFPLVVGIKITDQKLSGGFSDMGPAFASRLTNADLFKTVLYPVRSDDKLDMMIEASFSGKFVADGSSLVKAFFTGFLMFLPAPLVEYNHHYKATAMVQISQGGQRLKSFDADSDIIVECKIFAPPTEIEKEGVATATDSLMDRILTQLLNDKAVFSGVRPSAP